MQFLASPYLGLWVAVGGLIVALVLAFYFRGTASRMAAEIDALHKELEALQCKYEEECKWRLAVQQYEAASSSPDSRVTEHKSREPGEPIPFSAKAARRPRGIASEAHSDP